MNLKGGERKPTSLNGRIRDFLKKEGPATISQIVAEVGRYVSASTCMRTYEKNRDEELRRRKTKWPNKHPSYKKRAMETGRRRTVSRSIHWLCQHGHIIRIGPGLYDLPVVQKKVK